MAKSLSVLGLLLVLGLAQAQSSDFYFGVDLSYANEMDDCGAVYRENGAVQDVFRLFAAHGATLVRARLWHNPDWTAYSTLEDVKRTFTRAREAGMGTLLDIHYSDNWADPSRQEIPLAWEAITEPSAMAEAVYAYTYETLNALYAEDLTPNFVQVGNETNSGMLSPANVLDWDVQAQYFNAGIRAVRDFSAETNSTPQIILHVAQPENTGWWFSQAATAGITDFDVIGVSYYPQWSSFTISDIGSHVSYLRERFGKEVMIVETGYGWTREAIAETAGNVLNEGLRGYGFSPEGQYQFMQDLTQSLISNGALGVVYWEPAWVSTDCSTRWGQGSHWENATFFDFNNENEVLETINFLDSDNYFYPSRLADGHVEGSPTLDDDLGDNLGNLPALDLAAIYLERDGEQIQLAIQLAGDAFAARGNYLIYFDTLAESGATVDVLRRPITVADAYAAEFRLDVKMQDEAGTVSPRFVWNIWQGDDWETGSFTGGALALGNVIELEIPLSLLGNPQSFNFAVVSSDAGRSHTASDILGTSFSPADWDEALVLENFFSFDLGQ